MSKYREPSIESSFLVSIKYLLLRKLNVCTEYSAIEGRFPADFATSPSEETLILFGR